MKFTKKNLKKFIAILVTIIIVISCKTLQPIKSKTTTTIKDSTFVQRQTIDSLLVLRKSDTLKITAKFKDLKEIPIVKKSNSATLYMRRVGKTIQAECITDELKEVIELQREIINHFREIYTKQQETLILTEKHTPKFIKVLAWIGGIFAVFLIVIIILKIAKII